MTLALLGDRRDHASHRELDALVPRLADELGVDAVWVPTDAPFEVEDYDGVWLVPGSPYADDAAVLRAVTAVREGSIPFLGTCGGMQYAVVELTRALLGRPASHAESDGASGDNVVAALACSLYGEERMVTPVPGTRFASWEGEPFVGMHYCRYAPTPEAVASLEAAGVVVGAVAEDAGAEVLELTGHPFFVLSLFQPQVGASAGRPIHPLVRAFAAAL
ncbi:glutamine amidotransferase-related protein [Krasilnikoviella flava]|uniref:CTP synthase (glutamine hydrolyzing) n=1 Tax=Krasilnikoviella flava TaxID=526729 RepID=A0A1T5K857_9MICO|nr:CTP synthase [Krasilnikoviella flava]SKC59649.1 Glutamine amidotransferase class-I [Krasilnikoviella flava]